MGPGYGCRVSRNRTDIPKGKTKKQHVRERILGMDFTTEYGTY